MKREIIILNNLEEGKYQLCNFKFILITYKSLKYLCLTKLTQQGFCFTVIKKINKTKPQSLSNRPTMGWRQADLEFALM